MKNSFPITSVTVDYSPRAAPREPIPVESFEEIWEKNACWLNGRMVLGTIIQCARERRQLIAEIDPNCQSLAISLPLPPFAESLVPPELYMTFRYRCALVIKARSAGLHLAMEPLISAPATPLSVARANAALLDLEHQWVAMGERELWEDLEVAFGLLPSPMAAEMTSHWFK